MTDVECPDARLNDPPPLTRENGAERVPTLPVKVSVELDGFVMVMVWSDDSPSVTLPKSIPGGVTEILTTVGAKTLTTPTMPNEQWSLQK